MTEKLFVHLKSNGIKEIELAQDYYWHIPKEEIYDFAKTPTQLTAGQLSDDAKRLLRVLNNEVDPIGSDMGLLGQLLRYISENTI